MTVPLFEGPLRIIPSSPQAAFKKMSSTNMLTVLLLVERGSAGNVQRCFL
jgi:hypothetical protein